LVNWPLTVSHLMLTIPILPCLPPFIFLRQASRYTNRFVHPLLLLYTYLLGKRFQADRLMPKNTLTIYCHCAYYQLVAEQIKSGVLNAIKDTSPDFEAVADLCKMCADRDTALKLWAKTKSLKIVACYPRAVRWLFHAAGAPLPKKGVEFFNMRVDNTEKIISSLANNQTVGSSSRSAQLEKTGDWIPWFPVIDYDRCKNCKQCLNFCLFGVYKLSENGKVEVSNPANCKTNCPACARLCPQSAIIFPKYTGSPINGDEVDESTSGRLSEEKTKVDLTGLLSGDIYETIRRRSKTLATPQDNSSEETTRQHT